MLSNLYSELMAYEQISNGQYSIDGLLQAYVWTVDGPAYDTGNGCGTLAHITGNRYGLNLFAVDDRYTGDTMPAWEDDSYYDFIAMSDRRYDLEHQ